MGLRRSRRATCVVVTALVLIVSGGGVAEAKPGNGKPTSGPQPTDMSTESSYTAPLGASCWWYFCYPAADEKAGWTLTATLYSPLGGVEGAVVEMRTDPTRQGTGAGGQLLCTATTNGGGQASCFIPYGTPGVVGGMYVALFAGNEQYLPSSRWGRMTLASCLLWIRLSNGAVVPGPTC